MRSGLLDEKVNVRFKDWFKIKGIKNEMKQVHWLSKEQLVKNVTIVLVFTIFFGLFFYLGDGIIAIIMDMLGI